jgi:hypothetical protein
MLTNCFSSFETDPDRCCARPYERRRDKASVRTVSRSATIWMYACCRSVQCTERPASERPDNALKLGGQSNHRRVAGAIVASLQPFISFPVHPGRLRWQWVEHIGIAAEPFPDLPCLSEVSVSRYCLLGSINEAVALPAGKEPAPTIQSRNESSARAPEPRPLAPKPARSPDYAHKLL